MTDRVITHENELPRGTSSFQQMVLEAQKERLQIVDKTFFIEQVVRANDQVMLFTRPRRFGKSTNLSMLYYFLSNQNPQENRTLFKGFQIESNPEMMAQQGTYPVIMLNLKELKADTFPQYIAEWTELFLNLYRLWFPHLQSFLLEKKEKGQQEDYDEFKLIMKGTDSLPQIQHALQKLTYYIYKATGRKPWILIDEYDSAIYHAFTCGYHREALGILGKVLSCALKDNESLHKAVITGILRIAKESIFSGLNNIGVYSFQTHQFNDAFGFTAQEVRHLIQQRPSPMETHEIEFKALSEWYNGYECGDVTLYNPWSIVSYMQTHQFLPYWINTGRDDVLRSMFSQGNYHLLEAFSKLLLTGQIQAPLSEFLDFNILEEEPNQVWSIMVASGYLKVVNPDPFSIEEQTLVSPNHEVTRALKILAASILPKSGPTSSFAQGLKALLATPPDPILLIEALGKIFRQTVSFHDLHGGGENFAHGFILGVVGALDDHFVIRSNRESGEGRYDIALFPKKHTLAKRGILIELKMAREMYEEDEPSIVLRSKQLKALSQKAIEQILTKNYVDEFAHQGLNEVLLVGLAFGGKLLEGSSRHLLLDPIP